MQSSQGLEKKTNTIEIWNLSPVNCLTTQTRRVAVSGSDYVRIAG